jgi:hypothetical protein
MKNKELLKKEKSHAFSKDVYLLGKNDEGEKYWLEAPSWDWGWYWGFGYVETYLSNRQPNKAKDISSHSHISGFFGKVEYYNSELHKTVVSDYIHNLYDSPKLTSTTFTKEESWELSELFKQFYFLQDVVANFKNGKCSIASTTIESWEKPELVKEVNEVLIPRVTNRIVEILTP